MASFPAIKSYLKTLGKNVVTILKQIHNVALLDSLYDIVIKTSINLFSYIH